MPYTPLGKVQIETLENNLVYELERRNKGESAMGR